MFLSDMKTRDTSYCILFIHVACVAPLKQTKKYLSSVVIKINKPQTGFFQNALMAMLVTDRFGGYRTKLNFTWKNKYPPTPPTGSQLFLTIQYSMTFYREKHSVTHTHMQLKELLSAFFQ